MKIDDIIGEEKRKNDDNNRVCVSNSVMFDSLQPHGP